MVDRYTKGVLTVIALALALIAIQQFTGVAQSQYNNCGAFNNPCSVTQLCRKGTYTSWGSCDDFVRQP
jgi:hypothetical protein